MDSLDSPPPQFTSKPPAPLSSEPILPPSPVSNPALDSPTSKKRQRDSSWDGPPPPHIPEFLPPFPGRERKFVNGNGLHTSESLGDLSDGSMDWDRSHANMSLSNDGEHGRSSKRRRMDSGSRRSRIARYTMSQSAWDLPSIFPRDEPGSFPSAPAVSPKPVQSTFPHLVGAFSAGLGLDRSHKLWQIHRDRKWYARLQVDAATERFELPETLYGSLAPSLPRFDAPMPSHAMPISPTGEILPPNTEGVILPPPTSRPIIQDGAPLLPIPPYLHPQIPRLAPRILPPAILDRVTRLPPPKPLIDKDTGVVAGFGRAMNAPWNTPTPADGTAAAASSKPRLTNAVLRDTWDFNTKSYK